MQPIDVQSSSMALKSLSIRADIAFVGGKPSLKIFLCQNSSNNPMSDAQTEGPSSSPSSFFSFTAGQPDTTSENSNHPDESATLVDDKLLYNTNDIQGFRYPMGDNPSCATDSSSNMLSETEQHGLSVFETLSAESSLMLQYQPSESIWL
ncbi:hypothetical protein VKT23_010853 [Stygiomarasmius scandens]|uniref:Uncharacterized protein n=1 Tax=Marasmiellus scandens TaxID=2682957 RepID=A0ABR1JF27_9AGAR